MMRIFIAAFFLTLVVTACNEPEATINKGQELKVGKWLFELQIPQATLPFEAQLSRSDSGYSLIIMNAKERIRAKQTLLQNDSIVFLMPYFHSHIHLSILNDSAAVGYWIDQSRGPDYKIGLRAQYHEKGSRFSTGAADNTLSIGGSWKVTFSPGKEGESLAMGIFQQQAGVVTGTFLTETGDYRFLEGNIDGNIMKLSCFDGSHAFLFTAEINDEGRLTGDFWSGSHWKEDWVGVRDTSFSLTHPDSITNYKDSNSIYALTFMDLNGGDYSFSSDDLKSKVLIVQIMGSWCPNCADESHLFSLLYEKYKNEGLEVIGVAYERMNNTEDALKQLRYYKESIGANYPILYGGNASKKEAAEDFYMLDDITSFPTALFIDRKGQIRKIHTGFYGPGTGKYYDNYKKEMVEFLEILLLE